MKSSFKKTNLRRLIDAVNKVKMPQELMDRILQRLCDIGANAIREAYNAPREHHPSFTNSGESAASVKVTNLGDGRWEISAESAGLLFLEFGAGVARNPDAGYVAREYLDKIDTDGKEISPIGGYGSGKGGNPNGWYYMTDIMHYTLGTKAVHGFADAITAIYAAKDRVIQEEYKRTML